MGRKRTEKNIIKKKKKKKNFQRYPYSASILESLHSRVASTGLIISSALAELMGINPQIKPDVNNSQLFVIKITSNREDNKAPDYYYG